MVESNVVQSFFHKKKITYSFLLKINRIMWYVNDSKNLERNLNT